MFFCLPVAGSQPRATARGGVLAGTRFPGVCFSAKIRKINSTKESGDAVGAGTELKMAGRNSKARWLLPVVLLCAGLLGAGCTQAPEGITPVDGFEAERYLGRWYEIARMENRFEEGLVDVTAEYSVRDDGGINVLNQGREKATGEMARAEGRAYFVGPRDVGALKVSFFRPFYGGYNVIALDKEDYQWSMVCGPDRSYLWVLSRTPTMAPATWKMLTDKARSLGFDVDALVMGQDVAG
jgi:apolipoprotein D and lipocalin family protein